MRESFDDDDGAGSVAWRGRLRGCKRGYCWSTASAGDSGTTAHRAAAGCRLSRHPSPRSGRDRRHARHPPHPRNHPRPRNEGVDAAVPPMGSGRSGAAQCARPGRRARVQCGREAPAVATRPGGTSCVPCRFASGGAGSGRRFRVPLPRQQGDRAGVVDTHDGGSAVAEPRALSGRLLRAPHPDRPRRDAAA